MYRVDWQHLFPGIILNRGEDYYRSGCVTNVDIQKDFIKGTVSGSRMYDVKIFLDNGEIVDMDCNCPHAFDDNNCKHMVAVLCYADNEEPFDKVQAEYLVDLVQAADEAVVRDFLTSVLRDDEKLLNRFKATLNCELSEEDMKRYKKHVTNIFNKYGGKHGFVDYYNASRFALELEEFLDVAIVEMIENKQYEKALELTNEIFIKVGNLQIDDSDGYISVLARTCIEIWEEILIESDAPLKREMFRWFTEHLNGSVIDYMEEYLEEVLFENFHEEEFLAEKLKFTTKQLRKFEREKNSSSGSYAIGKWAMRYLAILEEQNADENTIEAFLEKYLEYSKVRKLYVEHCINRKEYNKAILLLEEGKQVDKDLPGLVTDYRKRLKNIYKQTGNEGAYKKELWGLALEYQRGDLSIFNELKALYSDAEWKEQREIIFEKISPNARIEELYYAEEMYDRLLQVVEESQSIYMLNAYEESLKVLYPQELLKVYEAIVQDMALHTSNRKKYREIVTILRRMKNYPGGEQKVAKIMESFRFQYSNRTAMMDEMRMV